jgi:hypothetical protein
MKKLLLTSALTLSVLSFAQVIGKIQDSGYSRIKLFQSKMPIILQDQDIPFRVELWL